MNRKTNNERKPQKILIAGGGIGGLTIAIALREAGFDCTLFEKTPTLSEVGAGITIWENALKVFRELGVYDLLSTHGMFLQKGTLGTYDGKILSGIGIDTIVEKNSKAQLLGIHRAELQQVLYKALPNDLVRFNSPIVNIQEEETKITIILKDGSKESGDLLVGADGIHSVVRKYLLGPAPPRYSGYTCWRGIGKIFEG